MQALRGGLVCRSCGGARLRLSGAARGRIAKGAIETDDAFYRPVVVAPNTRLFANESRQSACGAANTLPVGTPVSEPLQKNGTLVQVWVLDALWRWAAAPGKCAAVHQGPMWIEAAAIGRDYPAK